MAVITKNNKHEREAAALAWLSEALKNGWYVRYMGKVDDMYELRVNGKRTKCHQSDTLLEVIEKAKGQCK